MSMLKPKPWVLALAAVAVVGLVAYLNRPLETAPRPRPTAAAASSAPGAPAAPVERRAASKPPVLLKPEPAVKQGAATPAVDLPTNPNTPPVQVLVSAEDYARSADGPALARCGTATDPDDLCRYTQPRYLTDWAKAQDGDINAARRLALCVGGGCSGAVKPSPIEGCAWSLLIAKVRRGGDESDQAYVTMTCSGLTRPQMEQAYSRAGELGVATRLRDSG